MPIKCISLLLALLLLGCAPAVPQAQASAPAVTAVPGETVAPIPAGAEAAEASLSAPLVVTGGQQLSLMEGIFRTEEPEAAILVQENSVLLGQDLTVSSPEAAIALSNGRATLSRCTLNGSIVAEGNCIVSLTDCTLLPGEDGILFSLPDCQAEISMTGCRLPGDAVSIQLPSGTCTITLAEQDLATSFTIGEEAELSLCLESGAVLHAAFDEDAMAYVALELQEGALWILTDDCYLEVLPGTEEVLTDLLSRIQSNGFTIYYNCDNAQNSYLDGKPYELPGGGYLSPLI